MKKMIYTFCASILLVTASPIANAAAVDQPSKNSQVMHTKYVKQSGATKTATSAAKATSTTQQSTSTTSTTSVSAFEQAVIDLTNKERAKYNLQPLQADTALMAAAREKSLDMQQKGYFSHTSPTFGSPFDRMKALGISYRSAGENIAKGQRTPEEVVQAWMNSEGHRANILNGNYTHIGVGFEKQGYIWTQQFIQK